MWSTCLVVVDDEFAVARDGDAVRLGWRVSELTALWIQSKTLPPG